MVCGHTGPTSPAPPGHPCPPGGAPPRRAGSYHTTGTPESNERVISRHLLRAGRFPHKRITGCRDGDPAVSGQLSLTCAPNRHGAALAPDHIRDISSYWQTWQTHWDAEDYVAAGPDLHIPDPD